MSTRWKLFKVMCFLQMLATTYFAISALVRFVQLGEFYFLVYVICFGLITWQAIFALQLLNSNYPDRPVAGTQKSVFNWLFLLNFGMLALLFALFFKDLRVLKTLTIIFGSISRVPARFIFLLSWNFAVLIFQFLILYGLYVLRRELYANFFRHKQFEFENEKT